MNALQQLRQSAANTTRLANHIMANPNATDAEFSEAFRARDIAHVESLGMSEEQLAEARWETMCGCNGNDSPFHSYFGMESASDRFTGSRHEEEDELYLYDMMPAHQWSGGMVD